jgi:D-alanyl-D-alanine carboxypeptidase
MPKVRFATVTALLLFLLVAGATPAATPPELAARLDPFFDALERNGRLHGSVAVMKDGQLLYRRAVGMRAQTNGSPVAADANTMYRIGSITKVFTAVMIYQLIEEKKLALDTRLSEFFPSIPNAEQITIAHLLSHSSGIGNYPPTDVADDPDSWRFRPQTKEQMLARFAELKPDYAPGEKSTYSNTNFALLGYIIEAVTRSTYAEQLERRISRKIGLKRTRFGGTAGSNEALSFTYDESKWTVLSTEHPTVPAGAGAIVSIPTELAKFISAVFEHRLLKRQSVTEMLTPFSKDLLDCCGRSHSFCMFVRRGNIQKLWLRPQQSKRRSHSLCMFVRRGNIQKRWLRPPQSKLLRCGYPAGRDSFLHGHSYK